MASAEAIEGPQGKSAAVEGGNDCELLAKQARSGQVDDAFLSYLKLAKTDEDRVSIAGAGTCGALLTALCKASEMQKAAAVYQATQSASLQLQPEACRTLRSRALPHSAPWAL